jgi:hypothetical protein
MNGHQHADFLHQKERGQILVILALMLVGLIVIIGLVIDMGHMYVKYAHLRQAVDSAALAATSQFRKGYTPQDLIDSAQQFLDLNGIKETTNISIDTCETAPGDLVLCATPKRKIVRVSVTQDVPMYFLSLIGFDSVPITVTSVSEAASVDLILVIDTSESMTFGDLNHVVPYGSEMRDPVKCNTADQYGLEDGYPGECQPFEAIKVAASQLTNLLFNGYDRVGIVTFDRYAKMELALTSDFIQVQETIKNLSVIPLGVPPCPYSQPTIPAVPVGVDGPCRLYTIPASLSGFWGFWCDAYLASPPDPSRCGTTNIGDAMRMAGNALGGNYPTGFSAPTREDALWVVLLLTDGAANAAYDKYNAPICPEYTWSRNPFCRDLDARPSLTDTFNARHNSSQTTLYDADDYARDMIDFVWKDQKATIFSVGLGSQVQAISQDEVTNTPPGETLLKYAAQKGTGIYYYADIGDQLTVIFKEIGNKIATRLTR